MENKITAYLTSTASLKGVIREMDLDELEDMLKTITDPKLIAYINKQITSIKPKA